MKIFKANSNKIVKSSSSRADKIAKILSKSKNLKNIKFKDLMDFSNIETTENSIFLTFSTKKVFNCLK